MHDFHRVLIIADEAPVFCNLRENCFGLNVSDDMADVPLKRRGFYLRLAKRTEPIYAKHHLTPILVEHQREWVKLAIQRTERVNGAVASLLIKKGADVASLRAFQTRCFQDNLRAFSVGLRPKLHPICIVR